MFVLWSSPTHMRPGLDHIFIQLGSAPPIPPSLPGRPARTRVRTLLRREPMWRYPVKVTIFQADITFIIPKLIDGVPSYAKRTQWLMWLGIVTLVPNGQKFPHRCGQEDRTLKEAWEGRGPAEWRHNLAWGPTHQPNIGVRLREKRNRITPAYFEGNLFSWKGRLTNLWEIWNFAHITSQLKTDWPPTERGSIFPWNSCLIIVLHFQVPGHELT
jgi:hypothetical protein